MFCVAIAGDINDWIRTFSKCCSQGHFNKYSELLALQFLYSCFTTVPQVPYPLLEHHYSEITDDIWTSQSSPWTQNNLETLNFRSSSIRVRVLEYNPTDQIYEMLTVKVGLNRIFLFHSPHEWESGFCTVVCTNTHHCGTKLILRSKYIFFYWS